MVDMASVDVIDGRLAVVAPSEDGAESKSQDAKSQQGSAHVWNLRESHLG